MEEPQGQQYTVWGTARMAWKEVNTNQLHSLYNTYCRGIIIHWGFNFVIFISSINQQNPWWVFNPSIKEYWVDTWYILKITIWQNEMPMKFYLVQKSCNFDQSNICASTVYWNELHITYKLPVILQLFHRFMSCLTICRRSFHTGWQSSSPQIPGWLGGSSPVSSSLHPLLR